MNGVSATTGSDGFTALVLPTSDSDRLLNRAAELKLADPDTVTSRARQRLGLSKAVQDADEACSAVIAEIGLHDVWGDDGDIDLARVGPNGRRIVAAADANHIRPLALLGPCLTRAASDIPWPVLCASPEKPNGMAINFFAIGVGGSGASKSSAIPVAERVVRRADYSTVYDRSLRAAFTRPSARYPLAATRRLVVEGGCPDRILDDAVPTSGPGLVDLMMTMVRITADDWPEDGETDKKRRTAADLYVQVSRSIHIVETEVQGFFIRLGRSGNDVFNELRKAWAGDALGTSGSLRQGTTRNVARHSYRIAMYWAGQPVAVVGGPEGKYPDLLGGDDGLGTRARFLALPVGAMPPRSEAEARQRIDAWGTAAWQELTHSRWDQDVIQLRPLRPADVERDPELLSYPAPGTQPDDRPHSVHWRCEVHSDVAAVIHAMLQYQGGQPVTGVPGYWTPTEDQIRAVHDGPQAIGAMLATTAAVSHLLYARPLHRLWELDAMKIAAALHASKLRVCEVLANYKAVIEAITTKGISDTRAADRASSDRTSDQDRVRRHDDLIHMTALKTAKHVWACHRSGIEAPKYREVSRRAVRTSHAKEFKTLRAALRFETILTLGGAAVDYAEAEGWITSIPPTDEEGSSERYTIGLYDPTDSDHQEQLDLGSPT